MRWRKSLPARVALVTTGLLAIVLLTVTGAAYFITARLVQQGVDRAMIAAVPVSAGNSEEIIDRARHFQEGRPEERRMRVLSVDGSVSLGDRSQPVSESGVATAIRGGIAFISMSPVNGVMQIRTGPAWWQALTPREGEVRVMYARLRGRDPTILELASPIGMVSEVLPQLLWRILAVAALGTVVSGLITWRMSDRTYRPLRSVIAIADSITTETLSHRVPGDWQDQTLDHLCGVLNAMIGRLQQAFDAQGRFVAAAAHELRGPLSAMRTNLEVRLRRVRTPEEYQEALRVALTETERLTALSEHLLILARYERGLGLALQADLSLAPLLQRVAEEVRRGTGGAVEVDAPADLTLEADSIALERLVANLTRNAIQAGGAPVRIAAAAVADGGVQITVSDRGRGIPAEAIPHLFEPFYRVDPARSREGGTGLGLAIVKTVVDAHDGCIEVTSAPGEGSTFRVWLPRVQRAL
jgi:two-component system, OmpR family, sensor kinase